LGAASVAPVFQPLRKDSTMADDSVSDFHHPKQEPYVHQDYPKMIFRAPAEGQHPHDANKLVQSEQELTQALADGWSTKPVYETEAEEPVIDNPPADEPTAEEVIEEQVEKSTAKASKKARR
jgi:hypothetical protein